LKLQLLGHKQLKMMLRRLEGSPVYMVPIVAQRIPEREEDEVSPDEGAPAAPLREAGVPVLAGELLVGGEPAIEGSNPFRQGEEIAADAAYKSPDYWPSGRKDPCMKGGIHGIKPKHFPTGDGIGKFHPIASQLGVGDQRSHQLLCRYLWINGNYRAQVVSSYDAFAR